jgi:hypothetical protein
MAMMVPKVGLSRFMKEGARVRFELFDIRHRVLFVLSAIQGDR